MAFRTFHFCNLYPQVYETVAKWSALVQLFSEQISMLYLMVYQVHHQVLADQRETFLDNIIASVSSNRQTLENAVSTKDLDKLWSRINGVRLCSHIHLYNIC